MDARAQLTNAYKQYLGRDPEAGAIDWRVGQLGSRNLGQQIADIQNSAEAQQYKGRQASTPAAPSPDQQLRDQVTSLFNQTGDLYNNMSNPVDVYNAALEKLGLTDARTRVQGLRQSLLDNENLLRNIGSDVQARTQDFNVSDAQRRRLTAAEQAPLTTQNQALTDALNAATGDYQGILGEAKTQTDLTTAGEQAKGDALKERLATAITLSTNAEDKRQWQAEYDRLVAQDAESKRQFDMQYALDQQKAKTAAASSSSSKATQAQAQQQISNYILTSGERGSDGFLSPVTYKQLKSEWVASGWPAKDFDSNFRQYANTKHLKDYGL